MNELEQIMPELDRLLSAESKNTLMDICDVYNVTSDRVVALRNELEASVLDERGATMQTREFAQIIREGLKTSYTDTSDQSPRKIMEMTMTDGRIRRMPGAFWD